MKKIEHMATWKDGLRHLTDCGVERKCDPIVDSHAVYRSIAFILRWK